MDVSWLPHTALDWIICGLKCLCCCGKSIFPSVERIVLIVSVLVSGFNIGTDWAAFIAFAKDGFTTSPIGEVAPLYLYVWIPVIILSTIITVIEAVLCLKLLCKLCKKKEHLDLHDGQIEMQLLDGNTDNHSAHEEPQNSNVCKWLLLSSAKVIIQDGGNSLVGLFIFLICRIKTSTGHDLETKYYLLVASFCVSLISAIWTLCRMYRTVRGRSCIGRSCLDRCTPKYFGNGCLFAIGGTFALGAVGWLLYLVLSYGVLELSSDQYTAHGN